MVVKFSQSAQLLPRIKRRFASLVLYFYPSPKLTINTSVLSDNFCLEGWWSKRSYCI